jgi:hypothetical protein
MRYSVTIQAFENRPPYIAVETTANTNRGIRPKIGAIVIKLVQMVYMVGALADGVVRHIRTRRNFPKPPVGSRTAATRPPTLLAPLRPAFHVGTYSAAAVNAAPRICIGT